MKVEINAEFFKSGERIGCKATFTRPDGKPVMHHITSSRVSDSLTWFEEGKTRSEAFARAVAFGLDHFTVPSDEPMT